MTDTICMLFTGDIALVGEYVRLYKAGSPDWIAPFLELKPIFQEADIRVGNLESPLFLNPTPQFKRNLLGTPSEAVAALTFLDFTALSLANNHITDQGREGIAKTCEILDIHKITNFGAGADFAEAIRPAIVHAKGAAIAFFGYAAEQLDVGAKPATSSDAGCAPLSLDRIEKDIAAIRSAVSHIIVSLHWGYQFDHYPEPQQIEMARKIIDLGASIVHGHHPHILQGMERYKNGLILYSLGNFFFPDFKRTDGWRWRFPKESRWTAVARCEVGADGVHSVSLVPLFVGSDDRIRVLRRGASDRAIAEINRRSAALNAPDYRERWSRHHKKTMTRRARTELRFWLCGGVTAVWNRVRTQGLVASLKQLRAHHFVEFLHEVRRISRQNHSSDYRSAQ